MAQGIIIVVDDGIVVNDVDDGRERKACRKGKRYQKTSRLVSLISRAKYLV